MHNFLKWFSFISYYALSEVYIIMVIIYKYMFNIETRDESFPEQIKKHLKRESGVTKKMLMMMNGC